MPAIEKVEEAGAGFTLIEVIISFLILSLVLAGTTLSVSYSARLYRKADETRLAAELAERLIAERFDTRPGQAEHEAQSDGSGLRWSIDRKVLTHEVTANGGRMIGFDFTIFDGNGNVLDRYRSFYVERQP
jgi:type II secretory pathway pseudopilin PulG